jgi:glyoxylase-like metal-dependent hydrolase (beta-lactamase superfamily II)
MTDERYRRPATIRSLTLGDTRVSYLPDGAVQLDPRALLPDSTDETWAGHPKYLDDTGNLVASIGALLVERGDRALLIDAGFGPRSLPAEPGNLPGVMYGGALLDSLAQLGRKPAEIEAVAFTHLHLDHVGWAWHPAPDSDRPVFGHADFLVTDAEWASRDMSEQHGMPVLEPQVRSVADGEEIFPGVRVRLIPGHTAGHTGYEISSGDQRLIAFGDAIHSPIQVANPSWSSAFDLDPARSAAARHHLLTELADPGTIAFGIHFADVVFGRVRPDGRTWRWVPVG